jgi:hypothetical protein
VPNRDRELPVTLSAWTSASVNFCCLLHRAGDELLILAVCLWDRVREEKIVPANQHDASIDVHSMDSLVPFLGLPGASAKLSTRNPDRLHF